MHKWVPRITDAVALIKHEVYKIRQSVRLIWQHKAASQGKEKLKEAEFKGKEDLGSLGVIVSVTDQTTHFSWQAVVGMGEGLHTRQIHVIPPNQWCQCQISIKVDTLIGTLDDTTALSASKAPGAKTGTVGRLNSAAFNMFRNMDTCGHTGGGDAASDTELLAVHQNTITSLRTTRELVVVAACRGDFIRAPDKASSATVISYA
ncbi:hypothetical protein EDB19DRAFT_1945225 [Suillus lakei]|nr:hypothetical protein EDB19DRAFT_1945225 [Suillus lakei]